jgi:hypothetical protein
LARAFYRTRQVCNALWPRIPESHFSLVIDTLSETQQVLFFAMEKRDQRHAIEVARRLLKRGVDDPDLLQAALLHDCGKGAVPVWLRVLLVLRPSWVRFLATRAPAFWRGPAYRLLHHARIGAGLVASVGSSPRVVALVDGRAPAGAEWKLDVLRAADDQS